MRSARFLDQRHSRTIVLPAKTEAWFKLDKILEALANLVGQLQPSLAIAQDAADAWFFHCQPAATLVCAHLSPPVR